MSGDEIVRDDDIYRIKTDAGVILGTEYGGVPLAFENAAEAADMVERRAGLEEDLQHYRETKHLW